MKTGIIVAKLMYYTPKFISKRMKEIPEGFFVGCSLNHSIESQIETDPNMY